MTNPQSAHTAPVTLAVAGVDTLAGETLLERLGELALPAPLAIAYGDDAEPPMYRGRPLPLTGLGAVDLAAVDILIVVPGLPDSDLVSRAEDAGVRVLDGSDTLAQRGDYPLLGGNLAAAETSQCWAIADGVSRNIALALYGVSGIVRVDVSVVQPVSIAGRPGLETLAAETARMLNGQAAPASPFARTLAFNVAVDASAAEVEQNLPKLLADSAAGVEVNCHSTMASAFHAHLCQVRVEVDGGLNLSALRDRWADSDLLDYLPSEALSAVTLGDNDRVQVGDLVLDRRNPNAFRFTLVGDHLRHGVVNSCISLLQLLIKTAS